MYPGFLRRPFGMIGGEMINDVPDAINPTDVYDIDLPYSRWVYESAGRNFRR